MKHGLLIWLALLTGLMLTLQGGTPVPQPCKKVSIPPLPESVKSKTNDSSEILSEVQMWLQSALRTSPEKSKP